jgi:hypothetical protein
MQKADKHAGSMSMQNSIKNSNVVLLDDERVPGDIMLDEKIMHAPPAKFLFEVRCPNRECRKHILLVTLARGIRCPHCGYHNPSHKTYARLVKQAE